MSIGPVFVAQHPPHPDFRHDVASFSEGADFADRAGVFIEEGLKSRSPVLVAVTAEHEKLLSRSLGHPRLARFVDITQLGRNPSRIIPAITEFAQEAEGRSCRFISEPLWPGQTRAEIDEVARHEALIDSALSSFPIAILSLFQERRIGTDGDFRRAGMAVGAASLDGILSIEHWPLRPPAPPGVDFYFDDDLAAVRMYVQRFAENAGMGAHEVDDFVLCVNEIASNSVRYGGGHGVLRTWMDQAFLVCEVSDAGVITDPLVGRRPPGPDLEARGLWLVNQLSDLVQLRSGPGGTRVRIRLRCAASTML